jgi:hypothetical protein
LTPTSFAIRLFHNDALGTGGDHPAAKPMQVSTNAGKQQP